MAVTTPSLADPVVGIRYDFITDTSADFGSVANSSIIYNLDDKLLYSKDSGGTTTLLISGGLSNFTEGLTVAVPNATVNVSSFLVVVPTSTGDYASVPLGSGAFLLAIPDNTSVGGNKRGAGAIDLQIIRTAATQVASGQQAFVAGRGNTASGNNSTSIGQNNVASNTNATCLGEDNVASAANSTAIGSGNTATGTFDMAIGLNCNTAGVGLGAFAAGNNCNANSASGHAIGRDAAVFLVRNRHVFGKAKEAVDGDSQVSTLPLSIRTTDATVTTLISFPGAEVNTNQLTLQDNQTIRFKGSVIARESGATAAAAWDIDGFIIRGTTAVSTTLVVSNVTVVSNVPGYGNPTLAANTTIGSLRIQVAGLAATNLQWNCEIRTNEGIRA